MSRKTPLILTVLLGGLGWLPIVLSTAASAESKNRCSRSSSTITTVEEIIDDPASFLDECVTVTGITVGDPFHRSFYSDVRWLHRGAGGDAEHHRIGIL